MRISFKIELLILGLTLTGCFSGSGSTASETEAVAGLGVPHGWVSVNEYLHKTPQPIHDSGFDADLIDHIGKPGSNAKYIDTRCALYSHPLADGESLTKMMIASYEFLHANYAEYEISQQEVEFQDHPAVEKIYRRPRGEAWYQLRDTWFEREGTVWIISCSTIPDHYEEMLPAFDEALNGLHFK
jgi:hypothetical protein